LVRRHIVRTSSRVRKPDKAGVVRKPDTPLEGTVRKSDIDQVDAGKAYRQELTNTIARKVQMARKIYGRPMRYSPSYRTPYTQEDIAQVLDLQRPAIAEIEAGRRKLTAVELVLLAEFYNVPVTELLP
jgi:Helix-turn-helix